MSYLKADKGYHKFRGFATNSSEDSYSTKLSSTLLWKQKRRLQSCGDFDNFQCVQELRTGFFDDNGQILGERSRSREILLSPSRAEAGEFEIQIGHTDISEDTESGSIFFHPLAQSINRDLQTGPGQITYILPQRRSPTFANAKKEQTS